MAKKLLLVRHASTGPQWLGRLLGKTDVPIAAGGLPYATAGGSVAPLYIGDCRCSPLLRTRQTPRSWLR
jgi:broad specificity phosphatase PhoE